MMRLNFFRLPLDSLECIRTESSCLIIPISCFVAERQ